MITPAEFKESLQCWASGVSVVTTNSKTHGLQGMTVSAFASLSADAAQILCNLNVNAETVAGIDESQSFSVNFLTTAQQETSNQFAGGASMEERFTQNPWHTAVTGSPLLSASLVSLDCKLVEKFRSGSHFIVVGEIVAQEVREGKPLLYYKAGYQELAL
jgi:flavin reductase (DIM6/NTAB) family NADH-FMN oxidoreductase RutF